ncbi:MAG TPA: deoxyhypusine synthase [Polyangia bacterium]|jgi:deoxyhypusine synthase
MLHEKRRLMPPPMVEGSEAVATLVDTYFNAYNAARLREACQLFVQMVDSGATIGLSLSGALTPAGLSSVIVPLIQAGMVDYISSTGANLYHDLHFDLGLKLYRGPAEVASGAADRKLREDGIIRVYDVLFPADVLFQTDAWVYRVLQAEEFRGQRMGTSELHHRIGRFALETARQVGVQKPSILAVCHELDVPVYVASPGDSTIGLNASAIYTAGADQGPQVDPAIDVCEMSALVLDAKRGGGESAVVILGGGAPKNFLLQTEPQLQEILGVSEKGHDYFLQITDARPDTGGLSGATPSEAVSWGKIDPEKLPDCVVCYLDSTVALPIIASYALARAKRRPPRRLFARMGAVVQRLRDEYKTTEMYKKYWG